MNNSGNSMEYFLCLKSGNFIFCFKEHLLFKVSVTISCMYIEIDAGRYSLHCPDQLLEPYMEFLACV